MLEIKRLRLLWELHARGTIAAVAEALNYSPSAVSQQLATLERETGVTLLSKAGRGLELTAAGRALVAETESLLAGIEHAEAVVHRVYNEVSGTIRIAAFQSAMLSVVPRAVGLLHERHPSLQVEAVHYEPGAALQETWARGFDLVIAEQYPGHSTAHFPGLDRQPLMRDRIQLGVPPSGSGIGGAGGRSAESGGHGSADPAGAIGGGAGGDLEDGDLALQELAEMPWVMEPAGTATRHWAEQRCRVAGFEPDVRFESPDLSTHLRFIEAGLAVAFLPGLVHAGVPTSIRLIDLPEDPRREVFTATRASFGSHPALTAVRAALSEAAGAVYPA